MEPASGPLRGTAGRKVFFKYLGTEIRLGGAPSGAVGFIAIKKMDRMILFRIENKEKSLDITAPEQEIGA